MDVGRNRPSNAKSRSRANLLDFAAGSTQAICEPLSNQVPEVGVPLDTHAVYR